MRWIHTLIGLSAGRVCVRSSTTRRGVPKIRAAPCWLGPPGTVRSYQEAKAPLMPRPPQASLAAWGARVGATFLPNLAFAQNIYEIFVTRKNIGPRENLE